MRCDFQGIKLRVIASLITLYTVGFICHVAWNGYKSSVLQHTGLIIIFVASTFWVWSWIIIVHVMYRVQFTKSMFRQPSLSIFTIAVFLFIGGNVYVVFKQSVTWFLKASFSDIFEDLSPLIQNILLLLLFVLQHSLLKHLKYELNLSPARHRLLYLFSTTATLHVSLC